MEWHATKYKVTTLKLKNKRLSILQLVFISFVRKEEEQRSRTSHRIT